MNPTPLHKDDTDAPSVEELREALGRDKDRNVAVPGADGFWLTHSNLCDMHGR
jgi:hypothetical protein